MGTTQVNVGFPTVENHFNRALTDSEREAIMKDFPIEPACEAMTVPRLDEDVKDQLK